jgi:hypothetical protein
MALSTITYNPGNTVTRPAIEGCYKAYTAGATCPSAVGGTGYSIPVCAWSNIINTTCSGAQVQGCLSAASTRCFSSIAEGNLGKSYSFIVANVRTNAGSTQLSALLACYEPAGVAAPKCPAAEAGTFSLVAVAGNREKSGCLDMNDPAQCASWWKAYNFNVDGNAFCQLS